MRIGERAKFARHVADVFATHVNASCRAVSGTYTVVTECRHGKPHVVTVGAGGSVVYSFTATPYGSVNVFFGEPDTADDDYTFHACVSYWWSDDQIVRRFIRAISE